MHNSLQYYRELLFYSYVLLEIVCLLQVQVKNSSSIIYRSYMVDFCIYVWRFQFCSFSPGATEELSELQRQAYEIDIFKPLKQLIRDGKGKEVETDAPKVTNEETPYTPYPTTVEEQGSNNAGTPYAYPVDSSLIIPPHDEPSIEPFYGLDNDNFIPEHQLESNSEHVQPSDEVPTDLDKNDRTTDIGQGNCEPLLVPEENLAESGSGLIHIDEMKDEMDKLFEPEKNLATEVGSVENVNNLIQGEGVMQEVFLFHDQQVENDGNVTSVAGENSVLQETNSGGFVDMEGMGHNDFIPKESSVSLTFLPKRILMCLDQ